ncbi:MAG TPA: hypothetical protein VLY23_01835 [Candidatus Acidoferrum sp.]|nr:hypothetical protein [Candidatus Acidoferrum sp.]
MRRILTICATVILALPAAAWSRQDQPQTQSQSQQSSSASPQAQQQPPAQKDSLAEAARKAREQKEQKQGTQKPAKVFTNDNMPAAGGISTVGEEKEPAADQSGANAGAQGAAAPADQEKIWRDRFADLRHKLDQDQAELDVLQRELGSAEVQFYGGDPQKAAMDQMAQKPMGSDYTKKLSALDAKKKQVEADKQAISDAEDELRKAGGDPGWAR